ncbi:DUF1852 domain-containing protein [Halomonas sp. SF2003]|nr:DUF1852 domain-containing protein [Halomonas sp. SF2003]
MSNEFGFSINSLRFDENYVPAENTRLTTNFANLARGESRQQNLRSTLNMINNRFNALANWDNPKGDRYSVELDIISVELNLDAARSDNALPIIEILQTTIVDHQTNQRVDGVTGNNFSSYVRDYDFSVRLLEHNKGKDSFSVPEQFGELHGNLFQAFVGSAAYKECFKKPPIICISVSTTKTYQQTENVHPILGVEYRQDDDSLTDAYFSKMGLKVRYFMPPGSVAPLAFYHTGDLLNDYSNLELISTISTMDTFQKIYRPEVYNANSVAGKSYQASLKQQDHSLTRIVYDREERSQLAIEQGKFVEESFIKPYQNLLEQWSANWSANR